MKHDKRPAVVLDLYIGGMHVGRSLGRSGIPVYGVDRCDDSIGGCSRYISVLPAPKEEDALCAYLLEFSRSLGQKPVLIPTSDHYMRFLAAYYEELSRAFEFPYRKKELIDALVSKIGLDAILAGLGVSLPHSLVVERCNVSNPCIEWDLFPCILKPEFQDCWTGSAQVCDFLGTAQRCILLHGREELESALEKVGKVSDMVLQEFIPGEELYYYVGYRTASGRVLASFVGMKVRTYPHTMGSETVLRSVHLPELAEQGERILHALDYAGPAGIDFKRDENDGTFKVIEINSRIGLNDCYLSKHGVDLADIYYRDSLGSEVRDCRAYPEGITWYDFAKDLEWMRDYAGHDGKLWLDWARSLVKGYDEYAYFSWEDPKPFVRAMYGLMSRLLSKVNKREK